MPIPQLSETLKFAQIKGRNGQIHVVAPETRNAWLAARTPELKPPRIQLDLKQAEWIRDQLTVSPNQSELAKMMRIDRTSLIRTLNLTRLTPAIKDYIMRLDPDIRECPLTKKHLRPIATIADPKAQQERFKQLIGSLKISDPDYIKIPSFPE